jgi:hypothetical protein
MAETYSFELKGWHAVVALVVLAAFTGARVYLNVQTVDDGERQAIRGWLAREYQGTDAKGLLKRMQDAGAGLPAEPLPSTPMNVEIVSAGARGTSNHVLVKVQVMVDGGEPPDGQAIRYLELSRYDGAWSVLYNSSPYAYSRALWR